MMFPNLSSSIKERLLECDEISDARKELLESIALQIGNIEGKKQLILICTHNSRRSHLAQVWAQVAANYFGLSEVFTFSGGTEATRVYPSTLSALKQDGFSIQEGSGENPLHHLLYADDAEAIPLFSKVYDDPVNPQQHFMAIMTCDHAAENCPFIPNAHARFNLTYIDPKHSDGSPEEASTYLATSRLIAREMLYLFGQLVEQ